MTWILEFISWRSQLTSREEIADRTTQLGVRHSETITGLLFLLKCLLKVPKSLSMSHVFWDSLYIKFPSIQNTYKLL